MTLKLICAELKSPAFFQESAGTRWKETQSGYADGGSIRRDAAPGCRTDLDCRNKVGGGGWGRRRGIEKHNLLRQMGKGLLHWPLAKHWDLEVPSRRYPMLHVNLATSLRLNWVPWVRPFVGLPGWPQVIAAERIQDITSLPCCLAQGHTNANYNRMKCYKWDFSQVCPSSSTGQP